MVEKSVVVAMDVKIPAKHGGEGRDELVRSIRASVLAADGAVPSDYVGGHAAAAPLHLAFTASTWLRHVASLPPSYLIFIVSFQSRTHSALSLPLSFIAFSALPSHHLPVHTPSRRRSGVQFRSNKRPRPHSLAGSGGSLLECDDTTDRDR